MAKQNEKIKMLLDLIKENPDLRILPLVDSEVVAGDDFSSWLGSWGEPSLERVWNDDERIYIHSDDVDTLAEKRFDVLEMEGEYPNCSDEILYEIAFKDVNNYEWEKVILVKIDLP